MDGMMNQGNTQGNAQGSSMGTGYDPNAAAQYAQNMNGAGGNVTNQKPQKPKKKKKHRFLKFLLCVILIVLAYQGAKALCNKAAYNQLNGAVLDYPFAFSGEYDSMWYVTDDFEVPTYYMDEKGKEVKVEWTSTSRAVVFENGMAEVTRPKDTNITVVVTQTHKWLLGKASIQYELNVIPVNSIVPEQVDVVTLEELQNQTYNREMKAVLNEDGSLNYMIGDFKDTTVYSAEDAAVVLSAYREQFGADSELNFEICKTADTELYVNYIFDVYYNGYRLEDCNANITVDRETSEMVKIDINAVFETENFKETDSEPDYEAIIDEYISSNDEAHKDSEKVLINQEKKIVGEQFVVSCNILYDTGEFYTICIDVNSGEVLEYYNAETFWWDREATTAEGETEFGETITLDTSKTPLNHSVMYDIHRDIHTFDNAGWFGLYKDAAADEDPGIFQMLGGIIDYSISNNLNHEISAKGGKIKNDVAAQSQYYITQAYDWYKDTFGLVSYDGKGAPIVIVTGHGESHDNASWVGNEETFRVNPAKDWTYSVSSGSEVMAHEYTHAVFNNKLVGSGEGANSELAGINEAYADIFGCLSTNSTDWIIGKNELNDGTKICLRDIPNINRDGIDDSMKLEAGNIYPETYQGSNWSGECHEISVILSHVAYEMWASDLFTDDEVAKIWYNSLNFGYSKTSTYLLVREYVVKAAEDLSCSEEQILFIEQAFADVGIGEAPNVLETKSQAVEGDFLLDDTVTSRYLVVMSPMGTFLGKSGIYIYQESDGMSKAEMAEVSENLTELATEALGDKVLQGGRVEVEYKQVNHWAMDIVYDFCSKSEAYIEGAAWDGIGEDKQEAGEDTQAFVKFMVELGFKWKTTESTAYDFYDSLGLVK